MSYYPSAQAAPQPVDKEITGVLSAVEPRNAGWMRFSVQEQGRQYPYKADTKKQDVIQQAMSLVGQQVTISVREQLSTEINPHNGQPYTNRYLNGIAPAGYAPGVMPYGHGQPTQPVTPNAPAQYQQPQPQQPQQQIRPGITGYDKDINIMRQAAAKVVAMSWQMLPADQQNPVGLVEACETWLAYFVYGPLRFGVTPFEQRHAQPQQQQQQAREASAMADGWAQQGGPPQSQTEQWPCPDCGFTNQHAIGCPRADYS